MEDKQVYRCTGDCLQCSAGQRQYCASQFTYNSMRMIESMSQAIALMQGSVEEIKSKIESLQNNEALVFNPNEDIAQEGDGAEE